MDSQTAAAVETDEHLGASRPGNLEPGSLAINAWLSTLRSMT